MALSGAFGACGGSSSKPPQLAPTTDLRAEPTTRLLPLVLDADELTLYKRLEAHRKKLSTSVPRDAEHPWELAEIADFLALELEGLGAPFERRGFEVEGTVLQALKVTIPATNAANAPFVVLAAYDTLDLERGGEGAHESVPAIGIETAILLELVRLMQGATLSRPLQLVFLARSRLAEAERETLHALGSAASEAAWGVLFLRSSLVTRHLLFRAEASPWELDLLAELGQPPLQVREEPPASAPSHLGPIFDGESPGALLEGDSGPSELAVAALVTSRLRAFLRGALGERPTNDEMVTPLYEDLR